MFPDAIDPGCGPSLLEGGAPEYPDDLTAHTLPHVDRHFGRRETREWRMWLTAAGGTRVEAESGETFSNTSLALEAAVARQGVSLGSDPVAADLVAEGRLVRRFDASVPMALACDLLDPPVHGGPPEAILPGEWNPHGGRGANCCNERLQAAAWDPGAGRKQVAAPPGLPRSCVEAGQRCR